MKQNIRNTFYLLLSTAILGANFLGCASMPGSGESEKDKKNQVEKAIEKTPVITKVAFIPFDFTVETGKEKAAEALSIIATSMMERKTFQPSSLRQWMSKSYGEIKAKNIFQILQAAKKIGLPIDSICHGMIFKSGPKYGIILSVYPLKSGFEPTYYYRSFSNFSSLKDVGIEIVGEMEKRAYSNTKPFLNKSIFVTNFNINFYGYTDIKSGEGSIIPIPYLDINGVTYKDSDHFFHEILLYNLHTTRLATVWNSNMTDFIKKRAVVPSHIDYVISVDLDISEKISRLTIRIRNNKSRGIIYTYEYPFENLHLDKFFREMRDQAKIIILSILNISEQKKVGTVYLDTIESYQPVYCDNYYMGEGRINNLVLPAGTSEIIISSERYRIFISPYTINNQIFKLKDYFILDRKLQRRKK